MKIYKKYPNIVHVPLGKESGYIFYSSMASDECQIISEGTSKARVIINVSGQVYETKEMTLERYPNTLLGDKMKRDRYLCHRTQQYFFNRHRPSFDSILYFYQSCGKLLRPDDVDMDTFIEECEYFLLPKDAILKMRGEMIVKVKNTLDGCDRVKDVQANTLLRKLWNALEHAESSDLARIVRTFSLIMLTLSICTHCLETIPKLKSNKSKTKFWNITFLNLNSWFLLEFLMRLISSPNKYNFFKSFLNWIEIISLIPYFILIIRKILNLSDFVGTVRLLCVLRIFRIANNSRRLQAVAVIIKDGLYDFQLFIIVLLIIIILGGSMMFVIEGCKDGRSFTSIPDSFWWAIQSFLTVGYGDIVPTSMGGKLFAGTYIILGVIAVAIPTFSFSTKFVNYYRANR